MDNKRALSMIGLAQKAGKVASGEFSTEKAVKEHKAYMVIVADAVSYTHLTLPTILLV